MTRARHRAGVKCLRSTAYRSPASNALRHFNEFAVTKTDGQQLFNGFVNVTIAALARSVREVICPAPGSLGFQDLTLMSC
jgi:hypothetical protein